MHVGVMNQARAEALGVGSARPAHEVRAQLPRPELKIPRKGQKTAESPVFAHERNKRGDDRIVELDQPGLVEEGAPKGHRIEPLAQRVDRPLAAAFFRLLQELLEVV